MTPEMQLQALNKAIELMRSIAVFFALVIQFFFVCILVRYWATGFGFLIRPT